MGTWITLIIILFIVGSVMGLKPSAKETRLDRLRTTARKLGLNPKLVPCPNWITPNDDPLNKGKGMIAQYGVLIEHASLPACDYQLIDGLLRPYTDNNPANFTLDNQPLELPNSIAPFVKGLSFKANFACIYWQENIGLGKERLETTENDLILLKSQLQQYAQRIQPTS
ncbi:MULTISPECIES: hypothetical protein [unclassified Moraxella]|uniref:hypothetical protein n=1 Tax=unclassified Moraxella TaxID=2685852 RepID=UPI003AF81311